MVVVVGIVAHLDFIYNDKARQQADRSLRAATGYTSVRRIVA